MIKVLRSLLFPNGKASYTSEWPKVANPPTVQLDLAAASIGTLRFGDHIDVAKVLGRPDDYIRHDGKGCGLIYFEHGLYLEFDERQEFSFVTFHLSHAPNDPKSRFRGRPLRLSSGGIISSESSPDEITRLFGKCSDAAEDEDGTLLTHNVYGFMLDVYFSPAGRIYEVDVFKKTDEA